MKLTPEAAFRATMGTIQDSDIIIVVFHNMKPEDCLLSSILCFVQASQGNSDDHDDLSCWHMKSYPPK
ncbi:hypothetical protein [Oryza sativa Japonica Group]|uniref:Uncharacterized protein n=1 Tax=Oryza sativa subsp. japonica TaxID=39947 RepID=Q5JLK4_ORYSJ|nr:hypothetical protein [Oryza sativa Japonica Group]BAD87648.1 hypothetical protein [Oryza sativa Japonica Group]